MHVRFQNAAVFVEAQSIQTKQPRPTKPASQSFTTLWASRSFPVNNGKLVGVRLNGQTVEVALRTSGTQALMWVTASTVLTQTQVNRWLANNVFS